MGRRGPPPKPPELRVVQGTSKRRKHTPPEVDAGCPPPAWLHPRGLELWHEWAPGLVRDRILTERDQHTFALLCDAAAQIEALQKVLWPEVVVQMAGRQSYPQQVSLLKHYTRQFNDASTRMGFNPLDRQRLNVPAKTPKGNPFSDLGAGRNPYAEIGS